MDMEPSKSSDQMRGPIPLLNWINFAAYAISILANYLPAGGVYGETPGEISKKYQTLLSPNGALPIWLLIFAWEFSFSIAQLMPSYRHKPVIAKIAPFWIGVCLFQSLWSTLVAFDMILVGLILIALETICLFCVVLLADTFVFTWPEFLLLRVGFGLKAGWLMSATAVNFEQFADSTKAEPSNLLAIAVFMVAVLAGVSVLMSTHIPRPDAGIPLAVAWTSFWVSDTLKDPERLMSTDRHNPIQWGKEVTDGVGMAAIMLCVSCCVLSVVAVALRTQRSKNHRASSESLVQS